MLAGAARTGVLPCDIASSARQVLWSRFTAPVGWKSTAFHPEARAVHRAIQRREQWPDVAILGRKIVVGQGVGDADLRSGICTRGVVGARRLVCQAAKREMGASGAEMVRFLGVTTSSINRVTASERLPMVRKYLNAL